MSNDVDDEVAPQAGVSAGQILRKARERQGLHIAALAASLKVPPRKLELLEQDRADELPDLAFARALAKAACRTLKIDPALVLDLLPRPTSGVLDRPGGGLNTPYREHSNVSLAGAADGSGGLLRRPALWIVVLLAAAALAVYFWPPAPGDASQAAGASTTSEPLFTPAPSTADVPTSAAAVAAPAPAPAVPLLQLSASGRSFVKVTDATGRTLLSRALAAGETIAVDGELPLQVSVGNPAATQVQFRGAAVDLPPGPGDRVARIELR